MILTWPCKWNGCTEKLNEKDHNKNKKYCDPHRIESIKKIQKATNKKKYDLRKLIKKRNCTICHTKLTGSKRKFCSQKCSDKFFVGKKQQKEIRKSIEFHSKKIQDLVRKLN